MNKSVDDVDIAVLQRAYEREKARRIQAEQLLESKSRDLFLSYEQLSKSHSELERTNEMLALKQKQLLELNSEHESVTKDLELAKNLQLQILPSPASFGNVEVQGLSKPAMFVAGDIYDYYKLSEDVLAFYMADITGHGPAAAMVSYAVHKQMSPKELGICAKNFRQFSNLKDVVANTVADLNMEYAILAGDTHYFTLVYGLLNINNGEVCLCQAGHPAPIHYSSTDQEAHSIGNGGFPVGMFKDLKYTACYCTLARGDSLYIYSDGVTECFSPSGEAYGDKRLFNTITSTGNASLPNTLEGIEKSLISWNESDVFDDDVSILALTRH